LTTARNHTGQPITFTISNVEPRGAEILVAVLAIAATRPFLAIANGMGKNVALAIALKTVILLTFARPGTGMTDKVPDSGLEEQSRRWWNILVTV
jgi:hypothetical protein